MKDRGFTLIETLVVMMLVALIAGIVLSALQQGADLRQRLSAYVEGSEAPSLVAGWFRGSVAGLLADPSFRGEAKRFEGVTAAALAGSAGVPVRIIWELSYDPAEGRTRLRYAAAGQPALTVASWPGETGGFLYCGSVGTTCGTEWAAPSPADRPSLPALIRLDAVRGEARWPILAAPRALGDSAPPLRP